MALPAGTIADRFPRARVLAGSMLVLITATGVLVVGVTIGEPPFALIVAVTFVAGASGVQNVIVFGSGTASVVGHAGRPGPFLINTLVNVTLFGVSALTADPWLIAVALVVGDVGGPGWAILTLTLQAEPVDEHLRGRVMAAYGFLTFGAMSVGALAGGAAATAWGERTVFGLCAIATGACILPWWIWIRPTWRTVPSAPVQPSEPV